MSEDKVIGGDLKLGKCWGPRKVRGAELQRN
jgi:hypothetical protein